jgi:hypothetical protein
MVKVATIRAAIEASLNPNEKTIYLSHPKSTGPRSLEENVKLANTRAAALRQRFPNRTVVNPAGLVEIDGWDHDMWMSLWLPFIRERVDLVVMAPGWRESDGCLEEFVVATETDGVLAVPLEMALDGGEVT